MNNTKIRINGELNIVLKTALFVLSVFMMLCMCCVCVKAKDVTLPVSGKDGDLSWSIDKNGLLTITGEGDYFTCQWKDYAEYIKSAKVQVKKITSTIYMFSGCSELKTIDLSGLETSSVTSMFQMFEGCSALGTLDVSGFNTSKVTSFYGMFEGCLQLKELDLSGFDTRNVTDMGAMFKECYEIQSLDLSNFNTSKVEDMNHMFFACYSLSSLNISSFKTSSVKSMGYMFEGCSELNSLDISGFDTRNVTKMWEMFRGCSKLKTLNMENFNTSKVTDMSYMFYGCDGLEILDISGFDTRNVTNMEGMFGACMSLKSIDLSMLDTGKVTNMTSMFAQCSNLEELDISGLNTTNVSNMISMFARCSKLKTLNLSNFNTTKLENMECMFFETNLREIDLSMFDMAKVTTAYELVKNCNNLNKLVLPATTGLAYADISEGAQIDLPTNENCLWKDQNGNVCTTVSIRQPSAMTYTKHTHSWDKGEDAVIPTMTTSGERIYKCDCGETKTVVIPPMKGIDGGLTWSIDDNGLLTITGSGDYIGDDGKPAWYKYARYVKKANVKVNNITNTAYMFADCSQMTSIDLTGLDSSKVTDMDSMFYECVNLEMLDVSGFDTSNVTNMDFMFYRCEKVSALNVSNFDTGNVNTMQGVFCGCKNVTELDVSRFNTENVTLMPGMFTDCRKIKELDVSNFNTSKVWIMWYLFENCYELETIDLSNFYLDESQSGLLFCFINGASNLRKITMPTTLGIIDDESMILPKKDGFEWYDSNGDICEKIKVDQTSVMTYTRKCAGLTHTWNTGETTTPATATTDGIITYTCTICGDTKTEIIPATGRADAGGDSSGDKTSPDDNNSDHEQPPIPTDPEQESVTNGSKVTIGNGSYHITSTKEQTVTWVALADNSSSSVSVPETITVGGKKYTVTKIADNAFKNNKKLKKISISKNITEIGKNAFKGCKKLKTVNVGKNVKEIGNSAFEGCSALTTVTIEKNVSKIGKKAFYNCKKLKKINIKSEKLKSVGAKAFKKIHKKYRVKVIKKYMKSYQKLMRGKMGA